MITGSPPAQPTSRSGWTWTESSTWLKYLGPGRGGSLLEGRLVCAELANRGVKDVLIVEGAPPARERSARGNVTGSPAFPRRTQAVLAPRPRSPPAQVPPGSVPLDAVRLLMGTAARSRPLSRPTCTAPNQEAAWQALTDFSESDMGVKHPSDGDDLGAVHPSFWTHRPMLRRVISPPTSWEVPPPPTHRGCELPAAQGSPMNRGHVPFR